MTEQASNRVRFSETRCPYCHDEIARGEEPISCPACHAPHHEECLRERPACSGCGAAHPRFAPTGSVRVQPRGVPRTGPVGVADILHEIAVLVGRLFWTFVAGGARVLNVLRRDTWGRLFLVLGACGAALVGAGLILWVVAAAPR